MSMMATHKVPEEAPTPFEKAHAWWLRMQLWHAQWELDGFERERKDLERATRNAILARAALAARLAFSPAARNPRKLAQVCVLRPAGAARPLANG